MSVLEDYSVAGRVFEVFERCGGPCILHEPGNLSAAFLQSIMARASPLIVHTLRQQGELRERYGTYAHVTTCCPTLLLDDTDLTTSAKQARRERLGIDSGDFLVLSLARAGRANGMPACIFAADLLRSWRIPGYAVFFRKRG